MSPIQPLTHTRYVDLVVRAAVDHGQVLRPFVQIRRRQAVLCGRVLELGEHAERGEWFKVETAVGPIWAESRQVRLCSGDGRCTCEADK